MANLKKKRAAAENSELSREAEEEARREHGIETLTDDEELIDDATFSRLHARLMLKADDGSGEDDSESAGERESDVAVDELLLEEIATELPVQSTGAVAVSGPPVDSCEVAALERELLRAKSRDEVAQLVLRIARYHSVAAALFVVNRGMVVGLRGMGRGLEQNIEAIMLPASAESLIAQPVQTGRLARGAPGGAVDHRLLRALGRSEAREIAVLPIAIGQRVVNLLYADNGVDPMPETSIGALRVLCAAVGRVYERLILERKRAHRS